MKKYRLLVVLLRTNALARKPAQKLKLTHQSANRFRRPYQVDYIASLQAHSKRGIKPIHSPNQPLAQNVIPVSRYESIPLAITANRAFQGMAGLAVLYPSVVDYIGWRVKTLSASSTGL